MAETAEEKLARFETVIDLQMKEIDRLRAENMRLRSEGGAHGALRDIYLNCDLPESLRAKAAAAALPTERGKMPTQYSLNDVGRKERWMAYERWLVTKQSLEQTRQLPPPGWDAKLVEGVYEPPPGDHEPPMDLYGRDSITAHITMSELMRRSRRGGNGGDDNS
jgi:hypothetical protein